MSPTYIAFEKILIDLTSRYQDVSIGRMMSASAIQYQSKIFCFFKDEKMVFKIGRETDLKKEYQIDSYDLFSPFDSKPPMQDWFIVSKEFQSRWHILAGQSLQKLINS